MVAKILNVFNLDDLFRQAREPHTERMLSRPGDDDWIAMKAIEMVLKLIPPYYVI